jgi:YidC/Oxa1 family membrane protein insertase
MAMYPLLKKQLHHAMAMKRLQPEMKRIKKEAAGDKQKESQMMMALYKEREVNPFGSIGIILIQLPILIGLYSGINKLIKDPTALLTYSYSWVQQLPFMKQLAVDITIFNETLMGFVDLTRHAVEKGGIYWPAMILVILSVTVQFYQSKQLMMQDKNARSLKQIFKDTAAGKEVDQAEMQAATSRFTLIFIPFMLFIVSISLPAALSLYWLTGGIVAIIQQTHILRKDVVEMEATVDALPVEAEIISTTPNKTKKPTTKKRKNTKKRR